MWLPSASFSFSCAHLDTFVLAYFSRTMSIRTSCSDENFLTTPTFTVIGFGKCRWQSDWWQCKLLNLEDTRCVYMVVCVAWPWERWCVCWVRGMGVWKSHRQRYQSLNRESRWGTIDNFATNFLDFSLFSISLWDLPNSRPVHSLMFVFPPPPLSCLVFFPLSLCLARWFWPDLMNGTNDHTTAVCVSLRSSGGLRVVQLPAGSWHGLPRW